MNYQKSRETEEMIRQRQRVRLAFCKCVVILAVSLFLSSIVLSAANDVYAFVKSDREVKIIFSESQGVYSAAKLLSKNRIIKNPLLFTVYTHAKNKEELFSTISGELTLNAKMSYREILAELQRKST